MIQQQEIFSDTLHTSADTALKATSDPAKVFVWEKNEPSGNFPLSRDIHRDLTPDWVLYFILGFLLILAWLRVIYTKFIVNTFRASFNFLLAKKVYQEPGIVQRRIFIFLNFLYYLSAGIFLYLLADYFEFYPLGLTDLKLMGAITALLVTWSVFRFIIMKSIGKIFNSEQLFNEAIFHNFLFNKITGVVLTPFILLVAYTREITLYVSVYTSLVVFALLFIARIIRLFIFVKKSLVLLFYFILYLCALEIIPVLVIIKLIFSL